MARPRVQCQRHQIFMDGEVVAMCRDANMAEAITLLILYGDLSPRNHPNSYNNNLVTNTFGAISASGFRAEP